MHRYRKLAEVIAELQADPKVVERLAAEGLITLKETSEGEPVMSSADADRLRLVLLLTDELDINLPGVEVILHMRESMLAMQRQFSEILDAVVVELRRQLTR